jgi:hypothetical protein
MDHAELIARLAATPDRLRAAFAAAGPTASIRAPAAGEWSAAEVLAHIRSVDAILAPYIFLLTVLDQPVFYGLDERELAGKAGFTTDDAASALAAFTARRQELVQLLSRLEPADWERESLHTAYGPFTVAQYAAHLAAHEEEHLPQLLAALEAAVTAR